MSAPLRHGTRRMYQSGCLCRECVLAEKSYKLDWYRRHAVSGPQYVEIAPVLAHVDRLVASGMSERQVALSAGMDQATIWRLRTGRAKRMQRRKAEAILSLRPTVPVRNRYVPAARTLAIIERLHALGYSKRWMCAQAGIADCPRPERNRFVRRWVEDAFIELDEFIGDGGTGATLDGTRLGNRALPNSKRTGVRTTAQHVAAERCLPIDADKLRVLMDADGIDSSIAAEIAGYSHNTFSQYLRRGAMNPAAIDRLSTRFGVDLFAEVPA